MSKKYKKCGNLVDVGEFENMLKLEQNEGLKIQDLNERIYHQRVPNPDEITFEKKNMMSMILPEDLYIRENNEKLKTDDKAYCSDLDLLVPKQVKGMINNYKTKMHDFITKNLNLYENDQSIKDFIQNML